MRSAPATTGNMNQVPDYFERNDFSDMKKPTFLKGYQIDMEKCKVSRALPPHREELLSPDNIPGRLKDFEVNTSNMRLTDEPWSAHLRYPWQTIRK